MRNDERNVLPWGRGKALVAELEAKYPTRHLMRPWDSPLPLLTQIARTEFSCPCRRCRARRHTIEQLAFGCGHPKAAPLFRLLDHPSAMSVIDALWGDGQSPKD